MAQFHTLDILGDKNEIEIPMRYEQGFILVQVFLDGVVPMNLIFDTGAENTILFDRLLVDILGIPLSESIQVLGSDRNTFQLGYIARRVNIGFQKGARTQIDMVVLEELHMDFKNIIGEEIDGILGANFLLGAVVEIDYPEEVIRIIRPSYFKRPWKFKEYDITLVKQRPFVKAQITINERQPVDISLLLDTGASIHMLIDEYSHPELVMPDTVVDGRIGSGLGGDLGGFLGTVDKVELLDYRFQELPVYFQKTDSLALFHDEILKSRNGILGNLFWERSSIIIDYNRSKLYYRPNTKVNKAFRFNKSGMVIFAVGTELDEFIVKRVFPGSAADMAGVKQGDVIRRINGIPHYFLGIGIINRFLSAKEGRKIKLIVKSGGKRKKIEFRLFQRRMEKSELKELLP